MECRHHALKDRITEMTLGWLRASGKLKEVAAVLGAEIRECLVEPVFRVREEREEFEIYEMAT